MPTEELKSMRLTLRGVLIQEFIRCMVSGPGVALPLPEIAYKAEQLAQAILSDPRNTEEVLDWRTWKTGVEPKEMKP